ncbi:MAG: nucleoside monophosphate kinase [Candidatus Saccharimonadales bacterium]
MIIFLGPAGSGKSVQGQLLAEKYNWQWLSVGQLLRASSDEKIQKIMQKGKLVPNNLTFKVLSENLDGIKNYKKIILDGFPRSIEQTDWLINSKYHEFLDLVFVIQISTQEIIQRMELRGRSDDNHQSINERLEIYYQEINEIINHLKNNSISVTTINGGGSIEEVHERIKKELIKCGLL